MSLQHRERPGVALQREEGMSPDATVILLLVGPSLIVRAMNDVGRAVVGADWTGMPYSECVSGPGSRAVLRVARDVLLSGREAAARTQSEFRHQIVEINGWPLLERGRQVGVALAVFPIEDRRRQRTPPRSPAHRGGFDPVERVQPQAH